LIGPAGGAVLAVLLGLVLGAAAGELVGDGGIGWFVVSALAPSCRLVALGEMANRNNRFLAAGIVALASLLAAAAAGILGHAGACAAVFPACIAVRCKRPVVEGQAGDRARASCCWHRLCPVLRGCACFSWCGARARLCLGDVEGRALDSLRAITALLPWVLSRASLAWPRLSCSKGRGGRIVDYRPSPGC